MAAADYTLCSVCGRKAFYDVDVPWESSDARALAVLCKHCVDGHTLLIRDNASGVALPVVGPDYVQPEYWKN